MTLIIYTKPDCPYCEQAIEHYKQSGQEFTEFDAQNDDGHQRDMLRLSHNDPTVPAFVNDGVFVGSGWGEPKRGCVIVPKTS